MNEVYTSDLSVIQLECERSLLTRIEELDKEKEELESLLNDKDLHSKADLEKLEKALKEILDKRDDELKEIRLELMHITEKGENDRREMEKQIEQREEQEMPKESAVIFMKFPIYERVNIFETTQDMNTD